ncbi:MAG TPA: hypothetical protein VFR43_00565, partial [Gaiellaceae bacterium]|nr:hypothetical protein [Gaiellaceae bacterium]
MTPAAPPLGVIPQGDGRALAGVWAPRAASVAVLGDGTPQPLERVPGGFWAGDVSLAPAERYRFLVDGAEREDPCARARPEGVRGP